MVKNDEVFYKICFDSLIDGICIVDNKGLIVINNSSLDEIFGYSKGELFNKKIDILIPEAHRISHKSHFESYLKFPKKYSKGKGREFSGLHKNGSILDLEIGLNYFEYKGRFYGKALISEIGTRKQKEFRIKEQNRNLENEVEKRNNELTRVIAELENSNLMLKDEIKDRIKAEKNAKIALEKEKELNLMQTKFMSLASHEFKTPLSGILTSAGLIEKYNQIGASDKIKNHSITIKNLVYQLNAILDDFLYLEGIESENYSFQLSHFTFCKVINKIVEEAKPVLKEGQTIDVIPCKSSIEVFQDQKVIDIIIRNVLYNAIKYSNKGSKVELKMQVDDELIVTIKDEGIGIPSEAKSHVFERFYRAKNALPIQGTGIGLNIVKRHIEKLNGSIFLESEENKGTTVVLKIPLINNKEPESINAMNQWG